MYSIMYFRNPWVKCAKDQTDMSKVIKDTMLMISAYCATVQLVASQIVDGHGHGLFMILSQFGSNKRTTSICMYGSRAPSVEN